MKGSSICYIRMQLSVSVPLYIEIFMAYILFLHFSVFLAIQEWLSDTVDKIIVWMFGINFL